MNVSTAAMPRRADTTKGPPLRILSLDGGGVRGYSMFILLQELMHRTYVEIHGTAPKRHQIPKPCDHFDLIVGTGTGGLIAIMLGRLRMDLDICKDVYVRMTKKVFETDKTIAGIPYRSTLFKAAKLEEAIRDCVREHTVFDDEGNDTLATAQDIRSPIVPSTPTSVYSRPARDPQRSLSSASAISGMSGPQPDSVYTRRSMGGPGRFGNPNALLYDVREGRTKTAVTAVLKGTPRHAPSVFLRSYDSRKEPQPEGECAIWQAGRATCAIGLAFKSIQIRQSVFTDDGNGRFNPSPQVLDEAIQNEWPGREVGVFVSVGTGKRPSNTDHLQSKWYESFVGGSLGEFAEAKRRLMTKIEGCEETHQYMLRDHLLKRGVPVDNYFRLNVEVGVGEFGMNEWSRLSDVAINTRHYLNKSDVQAMNYNASVKLARIFKAKMRWERAIRHSGSGAEGPFERYSWEHSDEAEQQQQSQPQQQQQDEYQQQQQPPQPQSQYYQPPRQPLAAELPADEGFSESRPTSQVLPHQGYMAGAANDDKFAVLPSDGNTSPIQPSQYHVQQHQYPDYPSTGPAPPPRPSIGQQFRYSALGSHHSPNDSFGPPQRTRTDDLPEAFIPNAEPERTSPPPVPPKTPINGHRPVLSDASFEQRPPVPPQLPPRQGSGPTHMSGPLPIRQDHGHPAGATGLPYPDTDGPPPPVNMARKPEFR